MFYRVVDEEPKPVPVYLDGLYHGETLFLVGGSPELADVRRGALSDVWTLGLNNVPSVMDVNLWLSADRPECFFPSCFTGRATKFVPVNMARVTAPGSSRQVKDCPGVLFYGTSSVGWTPANFLGTYLNFTWWGSVFPIGLQLAWRLGFRRVYLVGCGFHSGGDYAWDVALTDDQAAWSQRTYDGDVRRVASLKPMFDLAGFEVVSSTPGSRVNDILGYRALEEAVAEVVESKQQAGSHKPVHSSEFR